MTSIVYDDNNIPYLNDDSAVPDLPAYTRAVRDYVAPIIADGVVVTPAGSREVTAELTLRTGQTVLKPGDYRAHQVGKIVILHVRLTGEWVANDWQSLPVLNVPQSLAPASPTTSAVPYVRVGIEVSAENGVRLISQSGGLNLGPGWTYHTTLTWIVA